MKTSITYLGTLVIFIFSLSAIAQVGIGTVTPDPSAILELDSEEQGFLTPRMNTSLRTSIADPAEGLIVFDTDDNIFYFFDGSVWVPLEGAVYRDNYKLVKSIADLEEELIAGGNTTYLLDENYLYEINGTVVFDFPIDLNGANLVGRDTGEDIIEVGFTGTLFTGTKGGRLKDLLIVANDQQVFDITGDGSGSMVGYSVLINNASSLGTLSNLFAVFFEVIQIVNTDDGLDASDVTSFFIDKIFWTNGNTGTFLTLSGTFGNLQIANGRVVADTGETGIDVSADPIITVSASLSEVDFSGDGTLVNPYLNGTYDGYNFSNIWDVDCPGILQETDNNATGDINFNFTAGGGENTTFTANQTPVKLEGATTSNSLFRFVESGDNRIVYDGKDTRYFNVTASISFEGNTSQDRYIFYVAKGNSGDATPTVIDETGVWRRIGGTFDIGAVPLIGTVELSPGDYIEVWAERFSGSGSLFTVALNLSIR